LRDEQTLCQILVVAARPVKRGETGAVRQIGGDAGIEKGLQAGQTALGLLKGERMQAFAIPASPPI